MTAEVAENLVECHHCAESISESDMHFVEGLNVCQDCVDDNYSTCEDCSEYVNNDDMRSVDYDRSVCESCLEYNYSSCEDCGEAVANDYIRSVNYDRSVCESCIDNNYGYCDDCDDYYHYDDSGEHEHDGCDCEAPQQKFRVRNDGHGWLDNDSRVKVELAAGEISDEGLDAIRALLMQPSYDLDFDSDARYAWRRMAHGVPDALGPKWQTKDGNYTKRLSRYAYKEFSLKLPPEVVSEVGNIARAHSAGIDFEIDVTRNLNLPAEDFAHADSCYWQSYSSSRCTLKSNGGFGLRTFGDGGWRPVKGRAWVIPLRKDGDDNLVPTFNTEASDAFIVFNGYGDLSGYSAARIMAHMAGMTYRKVGFSGSPMYVNGDSGYLVAPEDIASGYTDGSLGLGYLDEHSNLARTEGN